jgi:hypothetical protein
MGVLRRDRVRCLIREYDQLTCSDTVSGAHRTSYGIMKAHIVLWNGLQVRPRGMGEKKAPALVWAITLFPRGFDQVIPQVLALLLFYFPLVFSVGRTREGLLFGR